MPLDLYKEEILDHYKNPQNFGKIKNFNLSAKMSNPFCGDEIEVFLKLRKNSRGVNRTPHPEWTIADVGFIGKGCAISIASASILTEFLKGKTKQELTKFSEKDMLDLLGLELSITRKKCGLLAFEVLKDCLSQ